MLIDRKGDVARVDEPTRHNLEERLVANWPAAAWRDLHVVLAVSGGADSVAMLRAMAAIKVACGGPGRLYVAHLNHGLRGNESDADAAWLATLCDRLGLPLETAKTDVALVAAEQGDGLEAAARLARYDFLRQTAARRGARFVATGHTADDQVETILLRIVRGTGLAGLTGIPFTRPLATSIALVRPILSLWRHEILDYLDTLGQDWRADSSNDSARHARNRMRHEILPQLREQFNDDVDGALLRLAEQASDAQDFLERLATEASEKSVVVDPAGNHDSNSRKHVKIDCTQLAALPPIVVREVCKIAWRQAGWPLQAMGFCEWHLLANMVGAASQKAANLPANIRAHRKGQTLVLESRDLT